MYPIGELIPIVAILSTLLGLPAIVFYGILRIKRENRAAAASGAALGMMELEERIRRAVETANEPLRLQISALEERLQTLDVGRQLPAPDEADALLLESHSVRDH